VRSPWPGENDQPHETPAPLHAEPFPRRATDRVERATGVLVVAAALLAVVLAVLTAVSLHGSGVRQAANDAVDRSEVTATLTAPAESPLGMDATMTSGASGTTVPATWTGPDGAAHTGAIPVVGPQPAGVTVPIWVDRAGALAAPPVSETQAAVTSVVGGLLVLLAAGLLLVGVRAGVRARCAALNHRAWGREWADVGPRWTSGAGF
jgi:hypothetical protein